MVLFFFFSTGALGRATEANLFVLAGISLGIFLIEDKIPKKWLGITQVV